MKQYKYLIVGGGIAASSAVKGIRGIDQDGSVGIVGSENHPPYKRPWLSKKLWAGKPMEQVNYKTEGADLHLGRTVVSIDRSTKTVTDQQGETYAYEKLLLATGGTPRTLPTSVEGIIYYRNLDNYITLRKQSETLENFLVIGGSFIGSEVAAALTMAGRKVTMVFPGPAICDRIFPKDLASYVTQYYRDKGVIVLSNDQTENIEGGPGAYSVTTRSGKTLQAQGIIAGLGITPNTGLAEKAGLEVTDGVVVDELLRTSNPDIYCAGDTANFKSGLLGTRARIEHEDNALKMGRHAGANMAGANQPYTYHPYFYSDMFELGYEAIGALDSRLETFTDWKEPYKEGVIYYLENGRVRGALLWNVWDKVEAARELIAQPGPFMPNELVGRITG